MGDDDDERMALGEPLEPGNGLCDTRGLCRGRIAAPESQGKGPKPHGASPAEERQAEPAELRTGELELPKQLGGHDLTAGSEKVRGRSRAWGVARDNQASAGRQLLKLLRRPVLRVNAGRLVGSSPLSKARGIDPAGVDMRRAAVADERDPAGAVWSDRRHAQRVTQNASTT